MLYVQIIIHYESNTFAFEENKTKIRNRHTKWQKWEEICEIRKNSYIRQEKKLPRKSFIFFFFWFPRDWIWWNRIFLLRPPASALSSVPSTVSIQKHVKHLHLHLLLFLYLLLFFLLFLYLLLFFLLFLHLLLFFLLFLHLLLLFLLFFLLLHRQDLIIQFALIWFHWFYSYIHPSHNTFSSSVP